MKNTRLNWRIVFIIVFIAFMIFAIGKMYSVGSGIVEKGKVDLSSVDFQQEELVALNGHWEFYWGRLFSMLCFITALRSLIWGEVPLMIFFPDVSYDVIAYINYFTGYNLMPIMILFVLSIYPLEFKKTISGLVLLPTLFFDGLLLTPPEFMSSFTNYLYILILLQMIYIMSVPIKAVLHKRDNAILMFIAICVTSTDKTAFSLQCLECYCEYMRKGWEKGW